MRKLILVFTLALFATGCITRTATLVEFETGEVIYGKFTDSAATGGKIEITMPNGEVLKGRYSAVRGTDEISFSSAVVNVNTFGGGATYSGTGSAIGSQRTVGGQGRAYGLLTSTQPGSKLVMEIIAIYGVLDGHGFGEARTNDGRAYKVQF